jgi:hypothetical protein
VTCHRCGLPAARVWFAGPGGSRRVYGCARGEGCRKGERKEKA